MWNVQKRRASGVVALGLTASLLLVACGADLAVDTSAESETTADFVAEPIEWTEVKPGYDQGLLTVPVSYDDPSSDTMELFVVRRRASDPDLRIGSLLVNPGGPGFPGTDLAIYAETTYGQDLLTHFDIVGWDPRGTGQSDMPIVCTNDYDRYIADVPTVPLNDAERQLAVDRSLEITDLCIERNPVLWDRVGTNNTARDMNVLRQALGEETISYFGFSYGSELGATWATLFPETVRAAVLDGATDPNPDVAAVQQAAGMERAFDAFLSWCANDSSCAFFNDGNPGDAFDELSARLETDPVPTVPDRAPATLTMLIWAVQSSLYLESEWPDLAEALDAVSEGDGTKVLALYDSYFRRGDDGTYGHQLEAHRAITCPDQAERQTVAEADQEMTLQTAVAPRLHPEGSVGDYYCTFAPPAQDPRVALTGVGAGPIVVVGTTGDPATPIESSQAMTDALEDGHLVVVDAQQHTGYSVNDCIKSVVGDYLVDLVVPADGTEC
jgi:pimeloyl-ACP methyl ester carboxylesterase